MKVLVSPSAPEHRMGGAVSPPNMLGGHLDRAPEKGRFFRAARHATELLPYAQHHPRRILRPARSAAHLGGIGVAIPCTQQVRHYSCYNESMDRANVEATFLSEDLGALRFSARRLSFYRTAKRRGNFHFVV